jgi:hypothetical protein
LLGQFPVNDPMQLRHDVESGLQQIGMHADEAEQVAQRLIGTEAPAPETAATIADAEPAAEEAAAIAPIEEPMQPVLQASVEPAADLPVQAEAPKPIIAEPATPEPVVSKAAAPEPTTTATPPAPKPTVPTRAVEPPSATDLAIRLKQRQRLGEHRSQETAAPATQAAVVPPLGLREARIHNRLRQLPFGTWFEFTDPTTGEASQRKLAWFSPVSGNSLFVNRRGQRSDVMNLQELARAIASGRVREIPPVQENLLDRAWHALTTSLLRPASSPLPEARP